MEQDPGQDKLNPLRCDTETTWAYARFDLSSAPANGTAKQMFYSRLKANQAPSLLINTIGLHWDANKLKETVSFAVQSNRSRKQIEVIADETLLVIQLHCQPTSKRWLYDEEPLSPPLKIHLLALINRQKPGDKAADAVTKKSYMKESKLGHGDSSGADDKSQTDLSINEIPPESHIDFPRGVTRSASRRSSTFPNKREIMHPTGPPTTAKPVNEAPVINPRIDILNPLKSNFVAVPTFQNKIDFKFNDTSLLATSYLSELDSMRNKLKSNSLLFFTFSSSVVILIYTLCLFIYLRSRRHKSTSSIETQKDPQNNNQPGRAISQTEAQPENLANISQPFNLQMPPATRTRLNMMLGIRSDRNSRDNAHSRRPKRVRLAKSQPKESSDFELTYSSINNHELLEQPDRGTYCRYDKNIYGEFCGSDSRSHRSHLAYGTINVVRAIQQAATLAKSRLRNSRYHPNLNVIPELDVEDHQSIPERNYLSSFLGQNNQHQYHQPLESEAISPGHFNSLVQNAMTRDCSHNMKKVYNQTATTLFSKPDGLATSEPPVSRSRILSKVKQGNVYEEHNEHIDSHT